MINKIFKVGYVLEYSGKRPVYVFCKYDGKRLSLSGVIGPKRNGDAYGSCGQIKDYLDIIDHFCGEWDKSSCDFLADIWNRYHLNDMHAGTIAQENCIDDYLKKWGDRYDYNLACEILEASGLLYDDGYKYGSAWLFRPVPQTAIKWLEALPDDTDKLLSVAPVWAK